MAMLLSIGCGGDPTEDEGSGSAPAVPPAVDILTAVSTGNTQAVQQHLAAGTDPNFKNPADGSPILNAAAVYGHREIVDALIEKGAKINEKDRNGNGALHVAAFLGRSEVVELLLEKGADVNVKNNQGETAVDSLGADWRTTQFIASLLQIQVDQPSIQAGRAKSLKLLTRYGGKPGGGGGKPGGGGGLVETIRKQDLEAVKQALAKGADLEAPDPLLGVTPLNWASLLGNVEIARMLIEKGADINGRNRDGNQPLHNASFLGRAAIVELLLNNGADANARNDKGETPMVSATTEVEFIPLVAGFLNIQVDVDAAQQGRVKCVALLKNGTGAKELCAAVRKQDVAAVKLLLAKPTNANVQDPDLGITALAWAAFHGNAEIAGLLIASKANVNGKNRDGSRPLHSAAFAGHPAVLELLLSKGADRNVRSDSGETPLQSTAADPATTKVIAGLLQLMLDTKTVEQGRAKCIELLKKKKPASP